LTLLVVAGLTWGAGRINNGVTAPKQPKEEEHPIPRAA
jgi:hypothetical protein